MINEDEYMCLLGKKYDSKNFNCFDVVKHFHPFLKHYYDVMHTDTKGDLQVASDMLQAYSNKFIYVDFEKGETVQDGDVCIMNNYHAGVCLVDINGRLNILHCKKGDVCKIEPFYILSKLYRHIKFIRINGDLNDNI